MTLTYLTFAVAYSMYARKIRSLEPPIQRSNQTGPSPIHQQANDNVRVPVPSNDNSPWSEREALRRLKRSFGKRAVKSLGTRTVARLLSPPLDLLNLVDLARLAFSSPPVVARNAQLDKSNARLAFSCGTGSGDMYAKSIGGACGTPGPFKWTDQNQVGWNYYGTSWYVAEGTFIGPDNILPSLYGIAQFRNQWESVSPLEVPFEDPIRRWPGRPVPQALPFPSYISPESPTIPAPDIVQRPLPYRDLARRKAGPGVDIYRFEASDGDEVIAPLRRLSPRYRVSREHVRNDMGPPLSPLEIANPRPNTLAVNLIIEFSATSFRFGVAVAKPRLAPVDPAPPRRREAKRQSSATPSVQLLTEPLDMLGVVWSQLPAAVRAEAYKPNPIDKIKIIYDNFSAIDPDRLTAALVANGIEDFVYGAGQIYRHKVAHAEGTHDYGDPLSALTRQRSVRYSDPVGDLSDFLGDAYVAWYKGF